MREQYYSKGTGFILVYSIDNRNSFNAVKSEYQNINGCNAKPIIILVGNKCDLQDRTITTDEGKELAQGWSVPFFETSAQDNINIDELFQAMSNELNKRAKAQNAPEEKKTTQKADKAKETSSNTEKKGGCCLIL